MYSPIEKSDPQAGVAMANQDWETKLENEMRIVRRLLWKIRIIRGQMELTPLSFGQKIATHLARGIIGGLSVIRV